MSRFNTIVLIFLAIATAALAACAPSPGENGGESAPKLDSRIEEAYQSALDRWKEDFEVNFAWHSPVALGSEAVRLEKTPGTFSGQFEFAGFLAWTKKLDDPLAQDLALLSEKPFNSFDVRTEDKLLAAKVLFVQGRKDDIRELFLPPAGEGEDALEESDPPVPTKDTVSPDEWALWVVYNCRFTIPDEFRDALDELFADPAGLDAGIARALILKQVTLSSMHGEETGALRVMMAPYFDEERERERALIHVLLRAQRFGEADSLAGLFLNNFKKDAVVLGYRAQAQLGMMLPSQAKEFAVKALKLNPRLTEARITLATAYSWERKFEEALLHFEAGYDLDQYQPMLYPRWARALADIGRENEARDRIDRGLELYPDQFELCVVSGGLYSNDQEFEKALQDFRAAVELAPFAPRVHIELGRVLVRLGRETEAEPEFERAMELGFPESGVEAAWGRALVESEEFIAAEPHLEAAAEALGDDAGVHSDYAKVLDGLGKKAKAAAEYERAVEISFYDGNSAVQAARLYAELGDVVMSLTMLDKAVDAGWLDTKYIVENFPENVMERPEFHNILTNMNPQYGR